ncbi:hypothetical protein ANCCEY_04107 [Ancylostoma ceylanicum]|uniref:Uncharacterized protein n=1 Tax=Ancylostoma ceylanicum TaxID=53326 RepID=A0A0D6LXQ7_9BILA|nr:hypothetical protein ANCCEY_04107 [Ancylostoma ceylanicum]
MGIRAATLRGVQDKGGEGRRKEYSGTPEDSYKIDPYRAADSYRRYDDNYGGYKRTPYDFEKGATPGSDSYAPAAASHMTEANPLIMNRFRPTARRMDDRPSYIRTRSMDRKHPMGEEYDYGAHLRNGVPPEPIPDYTYVNYHDSSNGRAASVTKDEKGQPRSILKNKQGAPQQTMLGTSGTSRLTGNARDTHDRVAEESESLHFFSISAVDDDMSGPKKKRSLLSFNRRRTSEVRMGSDGKLVTNGYDDLPNYKRPSSPIEKIKSLFRKNDTSHVTSQLPSNDYYPGRYTPNTGNDKVYSAYPSTNVATAREAYVPQYRKYPGTVFPSLIGRGSPDNFPIEGSTTRDPASVLNRYSYTPGLTDQRRHWYDDHNIY